MLRYDKSCDIPDEEGLGIFHTCRSIVYHIFCIHQTSSQTFKASELNDHTSFVPMRPFEALNTFLDQ